MSIYGGFYTSDDFWVFIFFRTVFILLSFLSFASAVFGILSSIFVDTLFLDSIFALEDAKISLFFRSKLKLNF